MKTRAIVSLGLSALVLGGTMVGCAGGSGGIASASDRNQGVADKAAAGDADRAARALAKRDVAAAIGFAEAAVGMKPQLADYRVLLGQSYLQAGRFTSARQAFADALHLAPDNGKAALNYALTQTATGDWEGARKTLDDHAATIAVSDRGLATALAGDPVGAVALLTEAARSPNADAKTRQNLALALALAGQWQMAKVVASADISPAEVDKRIAEWAAFAQPQSAADQVSALLGVTSVQDAGQPVALALNASLAPVALADAAPVTTAPFRIAMPSAAPFPGGSAMAPAPVEVASAPVVDRPMAAVVVQDVPPPTLLRASPMRMKVSLAKAPAAVVRMPAKGEFYVQLGAYDSAGVAKAGWAKATRRYAAFGKHVPTGMPVTTKAGSFYRLSIGGFARTDANGMCRAYRARGGLCFVRAGAGDQTASWVRKTSVQFASR